MERDPDIRSVILFGLLINTQQTIGMDALVAHDIVGPLDGTAFDLAGSGKGSVNSMLAAIRLADRLTASS